MKRRKLKMKEIKAYLQCFTFKNNRLTLNNFNGKHVTFRHNYVTWDWLRHITFVS